MSVLLRRRETGSSGVPREARVSNPDPDELTVTIDDFDGDELSRHAWPVVSWPPSATAVPARGDRCLVVRSEIGRVWVVAAEWTGPALTWRPLELVTAVWEQYDRDRYPVGHAKSPNGWVALRGVVRAKEAIRAERALLARRLDAEFRPPTNRSFPSSVGGGLAGRISVRSDGEVIIGAVPPSGATLTDVWTLDGIGYWAED
ncbi:MAG TPA: hypothetical protein VLK58_26415 [Conexibacter sp.]|nr:hypothetical protein [Conexibacter sp.]